MGYSQTMSGRTWEMVNSRLLDSETMPSLHQTLSDFALKSTSLLFECRTLFLIYYL